MKPLSKAMIFIIVLVCSAIVISAIVIPLVVIFVIKPAAEAAEAEAAQNGEHTERDLTLSKSFKFTFIVRHIYLKRAIFSTSSHDICNGDNW